MRDQESKLLELGERLRLQAISDSQRAEERLALLLANQIQEKEARLMRAISSEVEVQANRHPSFPKDRARPTKKPSERAKEKGPDATGAEEFDPIREAFALFLNSDPSQHQLEAMWPSFDAWVLSTATQNGFGAIDLPDIFPKSRWLAWFPADDPSSWDDHRPSQTVQPRASLRSTSIQDQYFHQAAVPGPPQTYEYSHPPPQNNNIHSPSYPGDNSPPDSDGTRDHDSPPAMPRYPDRAGKSFRPSFGLTPNGRPSGSFMAPRQPSVTPHQRSPSRCRDPKPPECASLPGNLDPDRLVRAVKTADLPRPPIQRESLVDKVADFLSRFRSVMKANLQQEAAWPIHATRAYAKHGYSQGSVNFSSLNWGETKSAIARLSLSREPGPLAANYLDTIRQRTFEKSPSLLLRLQTVEEAFSQETRDGPHSLYSIVDNLKPPLHTLALRTLGGSFHETFAGCRDDLFHNLLQMEETLGHLCLRCGGYQHQEKNCSAQALPHLPRDQFGLYCTLCSRRGHLSSTCLNEPSLQRDYQPRPPQSGFRTRDSSFQAGAQPQAPNQRPAHPPLNTQRLPQPQQPQRPQQNRGAPHARGGNARPAQPRDPNYRATSYFTSAGDPLYQSMGEDKDPDFGEPYDPPEMDLDVDAPSAADPDDFPEEERIYFMAALSQSLPDPDAHADPDRRTLQPVEESQAFYTGVVNGPTSSEGFGNGKVFPCLINGHRTLAAWDTLSDICCADPSVFDALGLQASDGNVLLSGIVAGSQAEGLKYASGVRFMSTAGRATANLLCHPIGLGRIILSDKTAIELGATFTLPIGYPTPGVQSDKEWAKSQPGICEEFRAPPEAVAIVEKLIAADLQAHADLPDSVTVNDPGSVFTLELKPGAGPWWVKQYPIPRKWYVLVDEMVATWESKGWIVPAPPDCKINNPILPRPKVSGGHVIANVIRLCLDARWLNRNTVGGFHVIPDQATIYAAIGDYDMITEIDIDNGYNRIPLHEDSQQFTAFTQPSNGMRWMFTVLIYGIEGASGFFQRRFLYSLRGLHLNNKVYLDNDYIHTLLSEPESSVAEKATHHAKAVQAALQALLRDSWKVKISKCRIAFIALRVLGSLLQKATRSVDPDKVVDLSDKGRPKTQKQLVSLLAFINYLRDFIPSYDRILGPLESLRPHKKITEELWLSSGAQASLENVIAVLKTGTVLHAPDPTAGSFFVDTDASQFGVGAALYQQPEKGRIRFIGFTSKKFNAAQRNYPATKRELFALIHALYCWRHIVFGFKIIALVDHSSLTYIGTSTNYMVLDWLNFLQQFDLTVVHRPGFKHIVPDALSHLYELAPVPERQPSHRSPLRPLVPSTTEKPPGPSESPGINPRQDKRPKHLAQACDPEEVLILSTSLVDSPNPSEAASLARLFGKHVLRKKDPGNNSERRSIVHEAHHNGPHENATNLQKRLFFEGDFWWPTLYNMCREVCESCDACLRHNIVRRGFHPAEPNPVTGVNDRWGWDILAMPTSSNGFNFLLLIIDFASRKIWLRPLTTKDAATVAKVFFELACDFGFPCELQSDKDPSFCNAIMDSLKRFTQTASKWSVPFCPWTNSVIERHAQTAKTLLMKLLKGNLGSWDLIAPLAAHYLNSRIASPTLSAPDTYYFLRKARSQVSEVLPDVVPFEDLELQIDELARVVFPAMAARAKLSADKKAFSINQARNMARRLQVNVMDQGSCPTFLSLFRPSSPPSPIIPKSHKSQIP